jgi:hypothetical protein
MSAVLDTKVPSSGGNVADMSVKLAFSKKLQAVTNRIHSTSNVDEIILDVSRDICQLFEADRMTVYITSEDGSSIVSKVKTGLNSFKDIKLPISESSLAGYAALNKRHMNIKDVYDDRRAQAVLAQPHVPEGRRPAHRLPLQADADRADPRRGDRHRADGRDPAHQQPRRAAVLGAARRGRGRSSPRRLAIAFRVRQQMPGTVQSKFEYLVIDNVIAAGELDLATKARAARTRTSRRS